MQTCVNVNCYNKVLTEKKTNKKIFHEKSLRFSINKQGNANKRPPSTTPKRTQGYAAR